MGHDRIISYCNRPFTSAEEMEEAIIQRTNEVVKAGDLLYHLGDVAWSSYNWDNYFKRLNTKEIFLIWGNHDKHMRKIVDSGKLPYIRWAKDMKTLQLPVDDGSKHSFLLCHYAMRSWPGKGRGGIQLYGHSHGNLPGEGRQCDVGVDTNNFYPWAIEDIWNKLKGIEYKPNE